MDTRRTGNGNKHRLGPGPSLWRAASLLGALVTTLPVTAHADQALTILRRVIYADQKVAYAGRVEINVYRGGRLVTQQVQRITRVNRSRERIEVLAPAAQAGRVIVSDGHSQWEYSPRRNSVVERSLPSPAEVLHNKLDALKAVQSTLHPAYLGIATVAGRRCHVVTVSPPYGRRVRKKMWVDTEHFVELRWERYSPDGERTTSWALTSVDFRPAIDARTLTFKVPAGAAFQRFPHAARMSLQAAEKQVGFRAVVPRYLPPGFVFLRDAVGVAQPANRRVLWMSFTDGVDAFSLFQSQSVGRPLPAREHSTQWEAKGFTFVLVGAIPGDVREKIKNSTLN